MSYKTIFLLKARLELLEAWEWYEDKQLGLGDRFKQKLYKRIEQIILYPDR